MGEVEFGDVEGEGNPDAFAAPNDPRLSWLNAFAAAVVSVNELLLDAGGVGNGE